MGLFDRWQQRSATPVEFTNEDVVFLGGSYSGEKVTAKNAIQLVPVWSAVQLIAGTVGSLPLRVYRTNTDGTRVEAPRHSAARLLASPNKYMAGDELIETVMAHLLLWGNAFILKTKIDGQLVELFPMPPHRVKVDRDKRTGLPYYVVDGKEGPYDERTFIHIRGMSFDGLVGMSPIQMARQSLGTYSAASRYQGRFWKNNATPGGVLTHPSRLSPDAAERLRAQWQAAHSGDNANRVAILEEGMKYDSLSLPLADSRLLESMDANVLDVARIYNLPAHFLQTSAAGSSLTYSSTEMLGRHYTSFTLRRWLNRVERSLMRDPDLFSSNGLGAQMSCSFDTTDLTRGDNKTIADINLAMFKAGVLTRDEVRAEMNRAPLEGPADMADPLEGQPTDPETDPNPVDEGAVVASDGVSGDA